jgi:hypothetical protein
LLVLHGRAIDPGRVDELEALIARARHQASR